MSSDRNEQRLPASAHHRDIAPLHTSIARFSETADFVHCGGAELAIASARAADDLTNHPAASSPVVIIEIAGAYVSAGTADCAVLSEHPMQALKFDSQADAVCFLYAQLPLLLRCASRVRLLSCQRDGDNLLPLVTLKGD